MKQKKPKTNEDFFKIWLRNASSIEVAIVRAKLLDISKTLETIDQQNKLIAEMEKDGKQSIISSGFVITTWLNVAKYLGYEETQQGGK